MEEQNFEMTNILFTQEFRDCGEKISSDEASSVSMIPVSKEDVKKFIEGEKKRNTTLSTQRDLRILYNWLESRNERRRIYEIQAEELDLHLSEFFIRVRKSDETEYEPGSLQAMKSSFDRELKDNDSKFSLNDRIFSLSQRALPAKEVNLKKQGKVEKKRPQNPYHQLKKNICMKQDSLAIQLQGSYSSLCTNFFGLRGRDGHMQLKYGDVTLRTTLKGREYLEYAERESKTRGGTKPNDYRTTPPGLYSTGTSRDPVTVCKKFVEKRPEKSGKDNSPFYLSCVPKERI